MASYTGTGRSETPGDGFSEHAAPIAAALPAGVQDPLIHEEWDPFWKEVESVSLFPLKRLVDGQEVVV